jgi:hypothetical protein
MTSAYSEFTNTYEEFRTKFPSHPFTEELRNRISRGKFPSEDWLRARTKKMKDLMAPAWARSKQG